ncbi:type I-F CRISPR-associated protein Csy2 [Thiomicrorhabdus xiamenensis]|uniref:Type I-F CRISPR-associated protein Csy2 n=1 Tax=Thiomicrorhabdus xiamenensis TaxID=2739063 RepID=A0A7D4NPT9_9GAMM|nr:type I-F CRISPR-associated protein Csy2 [Thiomicrorhabdus xiamenensis]QKI88150.1 type I-F CRISPR-associated protein Csy2 [Thiomicrorhabdus xiamenensis]
MAQHLLLIPRVKIHNANALSSSYTIGFPAMTAWMGAVHFLERQLANTDFSDIRFSAMAVSCHSIDLQTYKESGGYVNSIIGTGNPLDKSGNRPSFIEEARCHLEASLVIECENFGFTDREEFTALIDQLVKGKWKLAGGDILSARASLLFEVHSKETFIPLRNRLMPGHCLVERRDLMIEAMKEGKDALDALLESQLLHSECEKTEEGIVTWHKQKRKQPGWIVPISTGYQGLSDLGVAQHQRDQSTPHRFAENIVTLGEFKMPFRFQSWDEMRWEYHTDLQKDLYLCQQASAQNN